MFINKQKTNKTTTTTKPHQKQQWQKKQKKTNKQTNNKQQTTMAYWQRLLSDKPPKVWTQTDCTSPLGYTAPSHLFIYKSSTVQSPLLLQLIFSKHDSTNQSLIYLLWKHWLKWMTLIQTKKKKKKIHFGDLIFEPTLLRQNPVFQLYQMLFPPFTGCDQI